MIGARRQARREADVRAWTERWTGVVFGAEAPEGPLPPVALEGLLEVRDKLRGGRARAIDQLFERYWHRDPRARDRMLLLAASFLEFAGYRQVLVFERFFACFQVRRRAGQWGSMRRAGTPEVAEL